MLVNLIRWIVVTAVGTGAFDQLGEMVVNRVTERLMPLLQILLQKSSKLYTRPSDRFRSMGAASLWFQQAAEELIADYLESLQVSRPGVTQLMDVGGLAAILDGIDEDDLAVVVSKFKAALIDSADRVYQERFGEGLK